MDKEKLFSEYEYLAKKYASKVYEFENLGFEYQDVLQEFRIKIWTAIQAYEKRLEAYEQGVAPKPIPIKFYLESACANKVRDFIKYINEAGYTSSIEDMNFDYGVLDETEINPSVNRFILNGVDLLEGLEGSERAIFSLFLKGYQKKVFGKVKSNVNAAKVIKQQREKLIKKYGREFNEVRVYVSYYSNED